MYHTIQKATPARRILCLVMCSVFLLLSLVSCASSSKPVKPSEEDLRVVATCEGVDIYYEELRYVTMVYKEDFKYRYGNNIWEDAALTEQYLPLLREKIVEALKINCSIVAMAKTFSIDVNEQIIQDEVQSRIDETVAAIGKRRDYLDMVESLYMTDHFVRYSLATDICEREMVFALKDLDLIIDNEKDFLPFALDNENYCATYHIFIGNDAGDSVDVNRQLAEQVHAMMVEGKPIEELIGSKYNEDTSEGRVPYHFTRGEMDLAYEEAAFALEIGEFSGVVECDEGFYIIERRPLDEAYVTNNVTTLYQNYQYAQVEALLTDYRKTIVVEWTEYGNSIDLIAMK